jgi:hypothetical protein
MPPNLSVRPTPVLLTDRFNFTVPNGAPGFWIPNPSRHDNQKYDLMIGWVIFSLVAFLWSMYGVYLTVMGNLRDQQQQEQLQIRRLSDPFNETETETNDEESRVGFNAGDIALELIPNTGLKTKALSPRHNKSVPHGLHRFPEFDDRRFRA